MQAKTYLQLVNEAIAESKVSLDPLTSANFASPPNHEMYSRFKTWVNRAYQYIVTDNDQWQFRQERAVVTIYPRLQLRLDGATPLSQGDVIECDTSGVTFEILDIHAVEDVELDTALEYTVSVEYLQGPEYANDLVFNESFSRLSPSPLAGIGNIKGRGAYKFSDLVPYVYEIDPTSFTMQEAVAFNPDITAYDLAPVIQMKAIPRNIWRHYYELFNTAGGRPMFVYELDDGNWDFYPRPDRPFDVGFTYTQDFTPMAAHGDTPILVPAKYHDLIMWTAVSYYADFDRQPQVFATARKHINKFSFALNKNELPQITVDIYGFDHHTGSY